MGMQAIKPGVVAWTQQRRTPHSIYVNIFTKLVTRNISLTKLVVAGDHVRISLSFASPADVTHI